MEPDEQSDHKAYYRKYPRVNMELGADFKVVFPSENRAQEKLTTMVETLGGGGLMFVSPIPLSPGIQIDMRLYYDTRVIPIVAEVVWTEPEAETENNRFRCGLEFTFISRDDLLHIHDILFKQLNQGNPPSA